MALLLKYRSISSIVLVEEAKKLWFEVDIVSKEKNTFYITWNWKSILLKSTDFWWNSSLGNKIANDKELSNKVLDKLNYPTAKTIFLSKNEYFDNKSFDSKKFDDLDFPLVLKPIDMAHWVWVMMNILSIKELNEKLLISFEEYDRMIIQEQIQWKEIRLFIVKWQMLLAINRIPAAVIGDGESTIEELISFENSSNILRGSEYQEPLSHIIIDKELLSYIGKQKLNVDDIPRTGKNIQLRWNSNIWTGGTMIDVSDKISWETVQMCIDVAKEIGLEICGIDIITTDVTKPLSETGWIILEINANPGIWWDRELTQVNTWREMLKLLFGEE